MPRSTKSSKRNKNKELVLSTLKEHQIKEVSIDFDGCGDSGQINSILYDRVENETLGNTLVVGGEVHDSSSWDEKKKEWVHTTRQATLSELIEQLCYDLLEVNHGGWEINSGSYGEFRIDVREKEINLVFNERVESVETFEESY